MLDVPPSELAWHYIREVQRWVVDNGHRNTVRRGDVGATLRSMRADAVFIAPPGRGSAKRIDPRIWMWEAWWTGDPYLNVERMYRETVFGARANDDASYERALGEVLDLAADAPFVIVQTNARGAERLERLLRDRRRTVALDAPADDERYLIASR